MNTQSKLGKISFNIVERECRKIGRFRNLCHEHDNKILK